MEFRREKVINDSGWLKLERHIEKVMNDMNTKHKYDKTKGYDMNTIL